MLWSELENQLVRRGLDRGQAHDLIWAALQTKALRVTAPAPMVEREGLSGTVPDDRILGSIRLSLPRGPVATLPVSQRDADIPPTLRAFRQIIAACSGELWIASPYLDHDGVGRIAEALSEAVQRGVRIRMLTREVEARQPGRTRGLLELVRLAGPQLAVRDYHTQKAGLSHYTSLHAKLLVADSLVAYVGSAEVRGNALEKNFEIGAVLWDGEAVEARKAFDTVWAVARRVNMSRSH